MPRNYDCIDIVYNGDLNTDDSGDLLCSNIFLRPTDAKTRADGQALEIVPSIPLLLYPAMRHILDVSIAQLGDWKYNAQAAGNVGIFIGEVNTKELAQRIIRSIYNGLRINALISPSDLKINVIPVAKEHVLIRFTLSVSPTEANNFTQLVNFGAIYDFVTGGMESVGS
jgi:hypothetical protein